MSCLALIVKASLVNLVKGNVHYLAKNPGGAHGRTYNVKWTDTSEGTTSCGIMSSVQSGYVAKWTTLWTADTDHASHSYVIQAYGIRGLVRGISGWKRSIPCAHFVSTPFGFFFFKFGVTYIPS